MTLQEQIDSLSNQKLKLEEKIDTLQKQNKFLYDQNSKQSEALKVAKEALDAAVEFSDWFMENSRQADHAHSERKEKLEETIGWKLLIDAGYNGLMASYDSQFKEALATIEEMEKR